VIRTFYSFYNLQKAACGKNIIAARLDQEYNSEKTTREKPGGL
jgi:hypothetical protein